jgi:hypothetical protein
MWIIWLCKEIYRKMDGWLCRTVDEKLVSENLKKAEDHHRSSTIQDMLTAFDALDAKAVALIGHLSLMVAAIAILHATAALNLFRFLFSIELIYYLLTLLIVIRVINYITYEELHGAKHEAEMMRELTKRGIYINIAQALTNVGTILLIVTLIPVTVMGVRG